MTRWFIPNPASVAPAVLAAQVTPPGVGTLLSTSLLSERMREFFFPFAAPPVFFSCTRAGLYQMAMEWFSDRAVLMVVNGPMSQEWFDIADDCRSNVTIFDSAYGTAIEPNVFGTALERDKPDVVMMVETDTFTGEKIDLETLCPLIRQKRPDALIVTDISGSVFCEQTASLSDICICASEMAMGLPPGLGMTVLNERAHTRVLAHNVTNGRYFNYSRQTVSRSPSAQDPSLYTLLNALNEQIDLVLTEGMPARQERMIAVSNQVRAWADRRGLPLICAEDCRAVNSTAVDIPSEILVQEMVEFAGRYGVYLTKGVGLMPKNSLIIYHGNDVTTEDAAVLFRVLDRFLADYDTRRRQMLRFSRPQG